MMEYRSKIAKVMRFTGQKLAEAFGIKVLSPFLDERVVDFALKLKKIDLVGERTPAPRGSMYGKLILRQAFPEAYSQWRQKEPIEQGSGTIRLRKGYFENDMSDEEFLATQHNAFVTHDVVLRDKEHVYFFQKFLEAFDHDLTAVPLERYGEDTCPACHFKLPSKDQDFCVTCGFWPARITLTNEISSRPAHEALAKQINSILNYTKAM